MSFADLADRYGDFHAPAFEVLVGEFDAGDRRESFTGAGGLVSGLRVDTAIDRSNRFSFTLNDVFDRSSGENGAFDGDVTSTFEPGAAVEVGMGYAVGGTTTLLRGRIDSIQPNFPAGGVPSLSVSGYDLRHGLMQGTGTGHWQDTDLASVVRDLTDGPSFADREIGGDGVTVTDLAHPEGSDGAFLRLLADENDYEFFSRAGTFHFRERAASSRLSPELTLSYGRALRSFTPGTAAPAGGGGRPDVGTVKVRHNDEVAREPIVGTAEVPGGGEETHVETIPVRSRAEAEQRARSIARGIAERGGATPPETAGESASRGETLGIPELQIGRVIELAGLGAEFSGRYHVESATHRIDGTGYTTSFDVRRPTDE